MDKLDCTAEEIDHPDFQFRLIISLGTSSTYYYGTGVHGVPEGAQWFDPVDGLPMSGPIAEAVRGWLRLKSEYALAEQRRAKMAELLAPPAPEPEPEPEPEYSP